MTLLIASCASSPKPLEVVNKPAQIERPIYPRPSGVIAPNVDPIVVTPERTEQWNQEVREGKRPPYVIIGYDEQDYLTFAQWMQELLRYIKSQNAVIDTYENEARQHNEQIKPKEDE